MAMIDWVRAKLASKIKQISDTEGLVLWEQVIPPSDPELAMDINNWGYARNWIPVASFCDQLEAALEAQLNPNIPIHAATNITAAKLKQAARKADGTDLVDLAVFDQWKAEGLIQ